MYIYSTSQFFFEGQRGKFYLDHMYMCAGHGKFLSFSARIYTSRKLYLHVVLGNF